MFNRTKSSEAYFTYKYGWSFAFSAISFLLTEVCNCFAIRCTFLDCSFFICHFSTKVIVMCYTGVVFLHMSDDVNKN